MFVIDTMLKHDSDSHVSASTRHAEQETLHASMKIAAEPGPHIHP